MAKIERFEDIDAWKTARELTRAIYRVTNRGQFAKDFALRDQIRRASISVMSNIAEGFESRSDKLFADFLGRARGSAGEVRSQLYIASDADYVTTEEFDELLLLAQKVSRQISSFMYYLHQNQTHTFRENSADYEIVPADAPDLTI